MAFNREGWRTLFVGNGSTVWHYTSKADAIATVAGSGYFNAVAEQVRAQDLVLISASDSAGSRRVSSATGAATVTVASVG